MIWAVVVVAVVGAAVSAGLAVELRRRTADRRRLQRAVTQLQAELDEKERSERARSEFMATASHELRSPLTSIKGFAELLTRGPHAASIPARQREFVDIIGRSADRLVDLVNELLDVAKLNAGESTLDLRPVDVGEAIRETAELMSARIAGKHQQLGIYVAPTLPPAMADANKLRQVISNLLTNAHLYTPDGGRIHIGAEADRAWVRIVVADSGIGMSDEQAERVFDRFYRAPGPDAGVPGTGLGLAIVRSLVQMHHGEVHVASRIGQGSVFEVLIPAAPTPADSLETIGGRRILIVEDDPAVAALIAGQLAAVDVETEIVADAEEALQALSRDRFDAITVDVRIGSPDGIELVRRLRSDRELQSVPAVFVTVDVDHPELSGEWTAGKPIDAGELQRALVASIRSGRPRVLAIGREQTQARLEPTLDELGIEYEWETTGSAAVRVSGERRFEVALLDAGLRNPQAVMQALKLRGRRLRKTVILFTDGEAPVPPALAEQGVEVVPIERAAEAVLQTLRGQPPRPMVTPDAVSGSR
ncbi:MAG TPA: ATP-binding protein [Solirubrobacteraceae bacterium]|nr:ATP-binding protein [Solirubrobacteraceae bacterium]